MPYHSKEARHGFSLAYSNCQNHYSRTLVLKYKHYVALTADVIAETDETEASLKKPLFHSFSDLLWVDFEVRYEGTMAHACHSSTQAAEACRLQVPG